MADKTHLFRYTSPLGDIALELDRSRCLHIQLINIDAPVCPPEHPLTCWLHAYFSGQTLPVLPMLARAKTPFQHRLRKALLDIPRGETRTYGELAAILNTAPRALGQALGANPIPILIPCHRVVAANGPGGFSCGIAWKKRLLNFEGVILPENP